MPNNTLFDFFQSKTELSAIDHYFALLAKNTSIEKQALFLEKNSKRPLNPMPIF